MIQKAIYTICLIALLCVHAQAQEGVMAWDFLKDSKFKKAYFTALDIKKSSKWLTKLDGPSSPAKKINIDGEEFYSINSCQNHACDTDNIIILYSPTSGNLFGKLSENERIRLIGSPQGKILEEIDKLYGDRFQKHLNK